MTIFSFRKRPLSRTSSPLVGAMGAGGAALVGLLSFSGRATPAPPTAPPPTPEQTQFFETKIRPLLAENCYPCHNKDTQQGGLRMDGREWLLKGGETGPSLVPGSADKSLLITAVHQTGTLKMPKGGKLSPLQQADLAAWVSMGAPWPVGAVATAPIGDIDASKRNFWSLLPVRKPALPAVKNRAWVQSPVDAFVLARLEKAGLSPAPVADRRTLLRRVTFDLTGLPPTPGEMEAFAADKSPDAWARVVDRLLASPRYGERWARLWLDVARYSDTKGYVFNEDRAYPNAYTYRDWVIDAFNSDKPYDRFVVEQLAADRLPDVQTGDDKRPLAALGFLTVGRRFLNSQPDIMDDRIDVTMRGFQATTVACARCHNHKFDPIPTRDYYSLYGVFASANEASLPISPARIAAPYQAHDAEVKAVEKQRHDLIMAEIARLRAIIKDDGKGAGADAVPAASRKAILTVRVNDFPDEDKIKAIAEGFAPDAKARFDAFASQLTTLRASYPAAPEFAMGLQDKPQPEQAVVFKRGNSNNRGDLVPRRFPACLSPDGKPRPEWTDGGRLELARAIASKGNPLTARVLVNRVWMHHFGTGIVRTPSDFGRQGERPTHPELLDYLAARFMDDGWSIKRLHRLILLSSTYKQASDASPRAAQVDPENRLLSHASRRRLDLEQMRDSLFAASGRLDTAKVGGPSVDLWAAPFTPRRAVYGYIERQNLPGTFRTFDFATPDATSAQRFRTTVPQQALFVMNSPLAIEQSCRLAARPDVAGTTDNAARVRRLYLRLFDRLPDADETRTALAYLSAPDEGGTFAQAREAPLWQYGWGGVAGGKVRFTAFTQFDASGGLYRFAAKFPDDGPAGYVSVSAIGGHPGRDPDHAVIRRWIAPRDGAYTVSGTIHHPEAQGDGVHARIVVGGAVAGEWTAHHSEAHTDLARVVVKKGQPVDFIVDCAGNDAFDSFTWSPVITLAGVGALNARNDRTAWSSERDFSGPPVVNTDRPLTRWERYTQALLMTNEWIFVD